MNGQASQKTAGQILAFADRQRVEKCRAVVVDILVRGLSGDRGGDDDAKYAQERDDGIQREGRVDEDFAAGPEIKRGRGKGASSDEGKQESQCEQNQKIKISGDAAKPLPKLKKNNGEGHD